MPRLLRGYRPLRPGPDTFDQRADRSRLRVADDRSGPGLSDRDDPRPPPGSRLAPRAGADGDGVGASVRSSPALRRWCDRVTAIGGWFRTRKQMQNDIAELQSQNSRLKAQQATSQYAAQPARRVPGPDLRGRHARPGARAGPRRRLRPRPVVLAAPSPSTPDPTAGVRPDQTVLNDDGLVGRVLRVTATTATVLLIVDTESVVGGRRRSVDEGRLPARSWRAGQQRHPRPPAASTRPTRRPRATPSSPGAAATVRRTSRACRSGASPPSTPACASRRSAPSSRRTSTSAPSTSSVWWCPSGTQSDRGVIEADGSLQ